MRILVLSIALILGLVFATPASAQGFPPGPWRGVWTGASGHEYQAELNFTMEADGHVRGQFIWMLVQSPRAEEQSRIGLRGVERIEGTFDAATGALNLRGVQLNEPNHIIGADVYRLVVSPNGQYIAGITENNGSWQGRIDLTRFASP